MIHVDKTQFTDLFPLRPLEVYLTDGYRDGIIFRFKTFYVKMYNCDYDTYEILGYRYHAYEPLVKMTVSTSELNDALGKFKEDNYLSEFEF